MSTRKRSRVLPGLIIATVLLSSCVIIFRTNKVDTEVSNKSVESPVKVHLNDGRTALFQTGASFTESQIQGSGTLYSLDLNEKQQIDGIDRSEVAAYEVFTSKVEPVSTVLVSSAVTAASAFGVALLSVAIFGSCPTIYTQTDSVMVLESELFSNSIAPMLEKRDITDIHSQPDEEGLMHLEIRNEALETHYINQLEMLEVSKRQEQRIVTDSDGRIYGLSEFADPIAAAHKGDDIRSVLSESDSLAFESTIGELEGPEDIQWDYIYLEFAPGKSDKGALFFELRNSLFPTVLLYDYLLGSQGVESLDWIGKDLETVSGAVALGDFHYTYMGLRVEQKLEDEYKEIGRIANTGPIAPREIAVPVQLNPQDTLRLRLKFLADSWRIDKLKLAREVSEPEYRFIPVASIQNSEGESDTRYLSLINEADEQYFVTTPGDRFTATFETTIPEADIEYSYMLAGQGYYIEWIRKDWTENTTLTDGLQLSADMIIQAQQRWMNVKKDFEQRFFESRIPVR